MIITGNLAFILASSLAKLQLSKEIKRQMPMLLYSVTSTATNHVLVHSIAYLKRLRSLPLLGIGTHVFAKGII